VDRKGLWFRILAACYSQERGWLSDGRSEGSVGWKDIVGIRDGGGAFGNLFPDNLGRHVGNGASTLFWLDRWVGDVPFSVRFCRLYDLCDDKLCTVAQIFAREWEVGVEAWK